MYTIYISVYNYTCVDMMISSVYMYMMMDCKCMCVYTGRIWPKPWPSSVWSSTAQTSWTSWPWASSSRAWPAQGPGPVLTSSTASTLRFCQWWPSRLPPSSWPSSRGSVHSPLLCTCSIIIQYASKKVSNLLSFQFIPVHCSIVPSISLSQTLQKYL